MLYLARSLAVLSAIALFLARPALAAPTGLLESDADIFTQYDLDNASPFKRLLTADICATIDLALKVDLHVCNTGAIANGVQILDILSQSKNTVAVACPLKSVKVTFGLQ